jgi:hypothetical protein
MKMQTQKITVHVPCDLLRDAQEQTGEGITETIKEGLLLLQRSLVYKKILEMRGTVKMSIDLKDLREDKDRPWLQ